jgi:uncharacterized protein (TIGR03435 family)
MAPVLGVGTSQNDKPARIHWRRRHRLGEIAMRTSWLLAVLSAALWAQTPSPAPVPHRFEIVSIKPSMPGAVVQDARMQFPRGRFEAVNTTVSELLALMFGYYGKVEGGPKWVETDRYDFVAESEGDLPDSERDAAVMTMLQERFHLASHTERRPVSGFGLTAAQLPPLLKPAADGEPTSIRLDERRLLVFQSVPMDRLANYLQQILRAPVVDHTAIRGSFDFSFDPYGLASPKGAGVRASFADLLREAVERSGFHLAPEKVTLMFTIIDHIERPSEN